MSKKKQLAWKEMRHTMTKKMAAMKRQSFLTDIKLVSTEGKEFAAHRVHLCAASDYFFHLFESGMTESQKGRVVLDQISSFAMSIILDFIYSGDIPDLAEGDINQLWELLQASDYLCINALSDYFGEHVSKRLNVQHFRDQWEMAELFHNKRLLHGIPKLIAINFKLVSNDPKFLELSAEQLKVVLQHPDLHLDPPDPIVEAILRWIQSDLGKRRHLLEELVSLLDITHLTHNYIDSVCDQDLIQQSESLVTKLNDAKNVQWMTSSKLVLISPQETDHYHNNADCFKVGTYDLETEMFSPTANMPTQYHSGYTSTSHKDHLYFSSKGGAKNETIFKYNPVTSRLSPVGVLHSPFFVHGTTILNGMMYVVGRKTNVGMKRRDMQRISLATGECEVLARTTKQSTGRVSVFSVDDHVYVVSMGYRHGKVNVERYSVLSDQWTMVCSYIAGGNGMDVFYLCCAGCFYGSFAIVVKFGEEYSLLVYDETHGQWRTNYTTSEEILDICTAEVGVDQKKVYFVDAYNIWYLDNDHALPKQLPTEDDDYSHKRRLFAITETTQSVPTEGEYSVISVVVNNV